MKAKDIISREVAALLAMQSRIDETAFEKAALYLKHTIWRQRRIVCSGAGKSGIIASKFSGMLRCYGIPAIDLCPMNALHGDLGPVTFGDCSVVFSQSGQTPEVLELLKHIPCEVLIAFTGNPKSELAIRADVVLDTQVDAEACPFGFSPTCSSTVQLAAADALAILTALQLGVTAEQLAKNHPR